MSGLFVLVFFPVFFPDRVQKETKQGKGKQLGVGKNKKKEITEG